MLLSRRDALPYEIDGSVYKVDVLAVQDKVGVGRKYPHHSIAHKFPHSKLGSGLLREVHFTVGRTGRITPIAIVSPINLEGRVVEKASLSNGAKMGELGGVGVGSKLTIALSGDVIPKVISSSSPLDPFSIINFPTICPSCGSELREEGEGAGHFCDNEEGCVDQKLKRIEFFSQDIPGLSSATINKLFKLGVVSSPEHLLTFSVRKQGLDEVVGEIGVNVVLSIQKEIRGWISKLTLNPTNLILAILERRGVGIKGIDHVSRILGEMEGDLKDQNLVQVIEEVVEIVKVEFEKEKVKFEAKKKKRRKPPKVEEELVQPTIIEELGSSIPTFVCIRFWEEVDSLIFRFLSK